MSIVIGYRLLYGYMFVVCWADRSLNVAITACLCESGVRCCCCSWRCCRCCCCRCVDAADIAVSARIDSYDARCAGSLLLHNVAVAAPAAASAAAPSVTASPKWHRLRLHWLSGVEPASESRDCCLHLLPRLLRCCLCCCCC